MISKKAYVKCKKCNGKGFSVEKIIWSTGPLRQSEKDVDSDIEVTCGRCMGEGKVLWIDNFFR
jgi:RecJ-like exonuclease